MKRINIGLQDKNHTNAKVLAVLKKQNLSDFIEEAVEEYIKNHKEILEDLKKLEDKAKNMGGKK